MARIARSATARTPRLRGALTALVTPFTADGTLDEAAYRRLVSPGRSSPASTASSRSARPASRRRSPRPSATGHRDHRPDRRRAAVPVARIPVVAGTGTNDTRASIEATRRAAALGADAALVVTPYYNRPDQRMLDAHFRAIADEGGLPIVVYNVPGRTGANVEADTFLRLAEHPRVIAVKEASANIEQIAVICRDRPRDVAVLVRRRRGDARGPRDGRRRRRVRREQRGPGRDERRWSRRGTPATRDGARRIHDRCCRCSGPTSRAARTPCPAKAAMLAMGLLDDDDLRAPLLPLDDAPRERLTTLLRGARALVDGGREAATARTGTRRAEGAAA